MSDTIAPPPPAAVSASSNDERVAYRGVFQRLFIRPEIGALIGTVGLWVFFWAVTVPFGYANGALNLLDYASTLGIMAVAVSMLMIGGEFDLSSGANTGAMGMLVILLSKETGDMGGAGLSLWIAIPISFVVAMGIGFFNGWMVEKTKLPSFTITLATYYVLIGAKLGFSKLIVDQIQVGDIRDASGYGFWHGVFAAEWQRNDHQFGWRDQIYTATVIFGLALLVLAVLEIHFSRRKEAPLKSGLIGFIVGVGLLIAGIATMHVTDNVAGNWLAAAIFVASGFIGLIGFARWRYEPIVDRGTFRLTPEVIKPVLFGLASLVIAYLASIIWDSDDATNLFFPFTKQGFRATLILVFGAGGLTLLVLAGWRARHVSAVTKTAVSTLISVVLVATAFIMQAQSEAVKFRGEAFTVVLVLALLNFVWAVLGSMFQERNRVNSAADTLGARLMTIGLISITVGMVVKLLFTTTAEIERGIDPGKASMRNVWFVLFTAVMVWVLGSTRFGSWTFAVGGNKEASRQVGVPAARTKTQLFMLVSGAAWLVGMLLAFRLNTIQSNTGNGEEFDYIIAAVVGGTLLTGGYGTALGGAIGAVIVGIGTLGIRYANWNSDWRFLFLGVILLLAVISNRWIRTKAEGMRR